MLNQVDILYCKEVYFEHLFVRISGLVCFVPEHDIPEAEKVKDKLLFCYSKYASCTSITIPYSSIQIIEEYNRSSPNLTVVAGS